MDFIRDFNSQIIKEDAIDTQSLIYKKIKEF